MSAIEALNKITERYHKNGERVHLTHLSKDCRKLLHNADAIIEVNIVEDPTYKLVLDPVKRNQPSKGFPQSDPSGEPLEGFF